MLDSASSANVAPTCPTEVAVEMASVSFGYDPRRPVLTGIDMAIPRGKLVAIMGGSGCGKTTILRLIGGALRAQAGKVIVAGQNVGELDRDALFALRRRVGMLTRPRSAKDRKSTRLNSSYMATTYAVICLTKKMG